jgi:ribonuclease T1
LVPMSILRASRLRATRFPRGLAILVLGLACALCLARSPRPIEPIGIAELPPEARQTIQLIRQGGPFPYRKDGAVFRNREGLLPQNPPAYYREYTVKTPRRKDRGARRIVTGDAGELYYSDDHYRSFKRIKP